MLGSGSGESDFGFFNITTEMDNTSLVSCAARNIGAPVMLEYSTTFATTVRILHGIFYILLLICGIFLNAKAIILIAKYKKLQTLSFVIAAQVLVLDLLVCIIIAVVGVANAIANQWIFGEHMCSVVGAAILLTSTVRSFLLLIFVIDRFLYVFLPFFYPRHKVKITTALSAASWILSLVVSIIGLVLDCFRFTPISWMCGIFGDCNQNCSLFLNVELGIIVVPLTVVPTILYTLLYIKARRLKKSDAKVRKQVTGHTDNFLHEQRATITYFLLFITVFALALPSLVVFLIIHIVYKDESPPAALYALQVIALCLVSIVIVTDPIVVMRNRDVREITDRFKVKIAQTCCPSLKIAVNEP